LLAALALYACGSDGGSPAGDGGGLSLGPNTRAVSFEHLIEPMKGASYDTGWQPAGAPVQVRFTVTARSRLGAKLRGKARLSGELELLYRGDPGGGTLELDVGYELAAKLKINKFPIDWEGSLPYLPNADYRFADTDSFTPFVLEGSSEKPRVEDVAAKKSLWSTPIPGLNIPLVGGGTVSVKVGGKLIAELDGRAIRTTPKGGTAIRHTREGQTLAWPGQGSHHEGSASYDGTLRLSGDLVISPAVEVSAPSIKWSYTLAEFPITIGIEKLAKTTLDFSTPAESLVFDLP
jgi:hypothetical protein